MQPLPAMQKITFQTIDRSTPEGQLLSTAICVIGFLKFRDKKPEHILELLKDINLSPLVNEPIEKTMERVIEKYKSDNN